MMFNFREFETVIKSALSKAGYKSALIKREDAYENEQIDQMEDDSLQIGMQNDYQHFVKLL